MIYFCIQLRVLYSFFVNLLTDFNLFIDGPGADTVSMEWSFGGMTRGEKLNRCLEDCNPTFPNFEVRDWSEYQCTPGMPYLGNHSLECPQATDCQQQRHAWQVNSPCMNAPLVPYGWFKSRIQNIKQLNCVLKYIIYNNTKPSDYIKCIAHCTWCILRTHFLT